jgi:hypothetical protein
VELKRIALIFLEGGVEFSFIPRKIIKENLQKLHRK